MANQGSSEKINFLQRDDYRNFTLICPNEHQRCYVHKEYLSLWSHLFTSKIQEFERLSNEPCTELQLYFDSSVTAEEVILFLEVVYSQKVIRNLKDLHPLMRVASAFECTPLTQAICVLVVCKSRQLREVDIEQRRRLVPLLFKILSQFKGEYLMGMYPALLADCTRNDIEFILNCRDYEKGQNADLPWYLLEHYVKAVAPGQQRAMEIHAQQWDYNTLPGLLPNLTDISTEAETLYQFDLDLRLADGTVRVNRGTLLAISTVFRSMFGWTEERPEGAANATQFVELAEDSLVEWSNQTVLMLTATVYGCLWRIMGIEDLTQLLYLEHDSPDWALRMFRFADKYNMLGLLAFYAEVLMQHESVSLMQKLQLADSTYRMEFLDMCCNDPLELARQVADTSNDAVWRMMSPLTKDRLLKRLASAYVARSPRTAGADLDSEGDTVSGTSHHQATLRRSPPMGGCGRGRASIIHQASTQRERDDRTVLCRRLIAQRLNGGPGRGQVVPPVLPGVAQEQPPRPRQRGLGGIGRGHPLNAADSSDLDSD